MKSTFLILFAFTLYAQAEEVEILERGMHHKRVRVTDTYLDEKGEPRSRTSEYTELENGMHRRAADGTWVESNPTVEMLKDRAVVRGGPLELTFLANANQDGAVTLTTPDGKVLRSHVLGLAYTDSVTGDSVMFAAIQDSQGEVVPPNQVIYRNAFAGEGVQADLLYTWTKGFFEQDVILRQAPPDPSLYKMPAQGVFIEVFTEMIDRPDPTKTSAVLAAEKNPAMREQMVMPDFIDETLSFGELTIGPGRAFLMTTGSLGDNGVGVGKTLETREGRSFLIERLLYESVKPDLDTLPKEAAIRRPNPDLMAKIKHTAKTPFAPVATRHLRAERESQKKEFQMASVGVGTVGYRIDYVSVLAGAN